MISHSLPPSLILLIGGALLPLVPRRARTSIFLLFSAAAMVGVTRLSYGQGLSFDFLDYEVVLCQVDQLSWVFGLIFSLITLIGGIYGFHVRDSGELVASLVYAAGALGVTFAGDFLSLLFFWELMALGSVVLIWKRASTASQASGWRYLYVHITGGSLLLIGIVMRLQTAGTIGITALTDQAAAGNWFILLGVAVNAAIPPLHAWLPDSYPKATVTGSVFLSAFTTKSAVYLLLRLFPGWEILVYFGVMMALYGVVYAVLANDIRGILAYHIVSQVGYMVAGAGIGTDLAINGAAAHAFSHILYKSLLFMGAGAVIYATGRSKLTELGGIGRMMWLSFGLYMVGAFSISGFPLFNGFISKAIVVSAADKAGYSGAYFLLMLAAVGTFLHTGLKLPYFTWGSSYSGARIERVVPTNMFLGMAIGGALCLGFGIVPGVLYGWLPYEMHFKPYTMGHIVESLQLLLFTFVGFLMLRRQLGGEKKIVLDTDWFYRYPAGWLRWAVVEGVDCLFGAFEHGIGRAVHRIGLLAANPIEVLIYRQTPSRSFDPNSYRLGIGGSIALALVAVVILAVWGMWTLG